MNMNISENPAMPDAPTSAAPSAPSAQAAAPVLSNPTAPSASVPVTPAAPIQVPARQAGPWKTRMIAAVIGIVVAIIGLAALTLPAAHVETPKMSDSQGMSVNFNMFSAAPTSSVTEFNKVSDEAAQVGEQFNKYSQSLKQYSDEEKEYLKSVEGVDVDQALKSAEGIENALKNISTSSKDLLQATKQFQNVQKVTIVTAVVCIVALIMSAIALGLKRNKIVGYFAGAFNVIEGIMLIASFVTFSTAVSRIDHVFGSYVGNLKKMISSLVDFAKALGQADNLPDELNQFTKLPNSAFSVLPTAYVIGILGVAALAAGIYFIIAFSKKVNEPAASASVAPSMMAASSMPMSPAAAQNPAMPMDTDSAVSQAPQTAQESASQVEQTGAVPQTPQTPSALQTPQTMPAQTPAAPAPEYAQSQDMNFQQNLQTPDAPGVSDTPQGSDASLNPAAPQDSDRPWNF